MEGGGQERCEHRQQVKTKCEAGIFYILRGTLRVNFDQTTVDWGMATQDCLPSCISFTLSLTEVFYDVLLG